MEQWRKQANAPEVPAAKYTSVQRYDAHRLRPTLLTVARTWPKRPHRTARLQSLPVDRKHRVQEAMLAVSQGRVAPPCETMAVDVTTVGR
jgi:hypothetical protein